MSFVPPSLLFWPRKTTSRSWRDTGGRGARVHGRSPAARRAPPRCPHAGPQGHRERPRPARPAPESEDPRAVGLQPPGVRDGVAGAGASGYMLKDDPSESLAAAIRAVAEGRRWLSPRVTELLVSSAAGRERPLVEELTEREAEVLRLMAAGLATSDRRGPGDHGADREEPRAEHLRQAGRGDASRGRALGGRPGMGLAGHRGLGHRGGLAGQTQGASRERRRAASSSEGTDSRSRLPPRRLMRSWAPRGRSGRCG